jgi:beta-lactamase regulating signal transducer with metallopeptidase domain
MIDSLSNFGAAALANYWLPLLAWTGCAFLLDRLVAADTAAPAAIRYTASLALILSLPFGFTVGQLAGGFASSVATEATGATEATDATAAQGENEFLVASPSAAESTSPSRDGSALTPVDAGTFASKARPAAVSKVARPRRNGFALVGLVSIVVIVLVLFHVVRLAAQLARLRRLRKLAAVADPPALELFADLRGKARLRRRVHFVMGSNAMSPMTFGSLSPVLAIPGDLIHDRTALRVALVHEMQHIRRNDYAIGLAVRMVTAPFAWHPLLRSLIERMEDAREGLCDGRVLESGNVALADYTKTLVRFACGNRTVPTTGASDENALSEFQPALAAPAGQLKRRIEAMTNNTSCGTASKIRITMIASLLLVTPLFVTACTSPAAETQNLMREAAMSDLPTLELQVDYLIGAIRKIEAERAALYDAADDERKDEINRGQSIDWNVLRQRKVLLEGVLSEKLQQREIARMEAAVGLTVTG